MPWLFGAKQKDFSFSQPALSDSKRAIALQIIIIISTEREDSKTHGCSGLEMMVGQG